MSIIVPSDIRDGRSEIMARALDFEVRSDGDLSVASELLAGIKALRARVAEVFDPIVKKANEALLAARAARSAQDAPLADAESVIKSKVAVYQRDARLAAERAQREEAERRRKEQEEARLADALRFEAAGNQAAADILLDAPIVVQKPAAVGPTRIAGLQTRTTWAAQLTDLKQLVAAVAAGSAPIELLALDTRAANEWARRTQGKYPIPGLAAVSTEVVAVTPGR